MIKGICVPPFIGDGQDRQLFTEFLLHFDFLFDIIIEQVFYIPGVTVPPPMGEISTAKRNLFEKYFEKFLGGEICELFE